MQYEQPRCYHRPYMAALSQQIKLTLASRFSKYEVQNFPFILNILNSHEEFSASIPAAEYRTAPVNMPVNENVCLQISDQITPNKLKIRSFLLHDSSDTEICLIWGSTEEKPECFK